jgi:16S rRNA (cytosine1402-N4)-methyltransferase
MMPESTYHRPVLANTCIEHLVHKPNGRYADLTFGGGGHSKRILEALGPEGRLAAFDQDPDAKANAPKNDPRFRFFDSNFRFFHRFLSMEGWLPLDGILADLGVSSHQLDAPERGFTFRQNAALDMRMNPRQGTSAAQWLAEVEPKTLTEVLRNYGEIKTAKRLSDRIVQTRAVDPIQHSDQLKALVHGLCPPDKENRFLAQVFQAIRIAINDEMGALKDMLEASAQALAPGGMLVVMSYHSLEDRLVKHYLRAGNWEGRVETDLYGNPLGPFDLITRSAIKADAQEQIENPRSRSVRLRIARKRP